MASFALVLFFVVVKATGNDDPPIHPFTEVENIPVWPYPTSYEFTEKGSHVQYKSLDFKLYDSTKKGFVSLEDDDVINPLIKRYEKFLYLRKKIQGVEKYPVLLQVKDLSDRTLRFGVPENYTMHVETVGISIYCETIFGVIRALETFAQLVEDQTIQLLPIHIVDTPRYPWRGLMIDVARHYLKISTIEKLIDGMAYNKLNSLHIHLTDAQSFPYVIPDFPLLSEKGAYDGEKAIYTPDQLKELVRYAYLRGIRIIPEIDIPGHAASWAGGYPEIVADCVTQRNNVNNFPLDPSNPKTFEIVEGVIDSLNDIFPDEFVHLGGDEVRFACWEEIKKIKEYMESHSLATGKELQGMFMNQVIKYTKKKAIAWQELAQHPPQSHQITRDYLIEVWQNPDDMAPVLENGYSVINSAGWYFDRQRPMYKDYYLMLDVWKDMWVIEPESYVDEQYYSKIFGGEGCMWGEQVNDQVIEQRIFPKLCAVAERLWSPKKVNINRWDLKVLRKRARRRAGEIIDESYDEFPTTLDIVEKRLMHHICHNHLRRGIDASPIRPDYCPLEDDIEN